MKIAILSLGLVLISLACSSFESTPRASTQQQPAVELFNGQDLTGWSIKGKGGRATFDVADGVITGTSAKGGANTFLCSDKTYKNFELEVEVKLDQKDHSYMNSGIQIRSIVKPEGDKDAGRVSGWQCEIDPSERAWTGGVQEECGRAWLQPQKSTEKGAPLPEFAAGKAFKKNDWNQIRIVCEGHRVRTWVNGVPGADLTDEKGRLEGFIALQVHAGPEGKLYHFRKIQLRELP